MSVRIESSWHKALSSEWDKEYFKNLTETVRTKYACSRPGNRVFPPGKFIFRAFDLCGFDDVKVVILGQDPYHGEGQANGLAFSVNPGVALPPSLINILKEIHADLGHDSIASDGDLSKWATQGVMLLNATLTVDQGKAGSHQGLGWEQFTDAAIKTLSDQKNGLVFILWGSYAISKGRIIDSARHLVLTSPHPSPLSAYRGFFGSRPFSKANSYLVSQGKSPVNW